MLEINFDELTIDKLNTETMEDYKIILDDIDFYFRIHLKPDNNKMVIFSNGAIQPEKKAPPLFMRSKYHEEIDANCIYIDDRTIHNNGLKIGWGIGTEDRHFIYDYHKIVMKIITLLNIDSNKCSYYGSSAGGFMSILLSSLNKGSQAIVNNPQIFVFNYVKFSVQQVYKNIFPNLNEKEILQNYRERFSVPVFIKNNKYTPRIHYYQNISCKSDITNQMLPFRKSIFARKLFKNRISFTQYYDDKRGHNPIPMTNTVKIINYHINNSDLRFN